MKTQRQSQAALIAFSILLGAVGCSTRPNSTDQARQPGPSPDSGSHEIAPPPKTAGKPHHDHPIVEGIERNAPGLAESADQQLARLKKGNLAFNTPQTMKTGATAHVTARIASDKVSLQVLESGISNGGGTTTQTASTPISAMMKMTLKSGDFDITALSTEEQSVGGETPTQWEWDIVPKHAGDLRLHLAATVELENLTRDFAAVDRDVIVKVDPVGAVSNFVESNATWVLGSLGAGIVAAWTWLKQRKKSGGTGGQAAV